MKHVLRFVFAFVLAISFIPALTSPAVFADPPVNGPGGYWSGAISGTYGKGTKNDPVLVNNYTELKNALQYSVDGLYIKCNDFTYPTGLDFQPITVTTNRAPMIQVTTVKHLTINANIKFLSATAGTGANYAYSIIDVTGGNLTLDGTGKISAQFSDQSGINPILSVGSNGTLTVEGNLCFDANHRSTEYVSAQLHARSIYVGSGGACRIDSGTFYGCGAILKNGSASTSPSQAVWVNTGGRLIVNGGDFKCADDRNAPYFHALSVADNTCATLTGGYFYNGLKTNSGTLSQILKTGYSYKDDYNNTISPGSATQSKLHVSYTGGGSTPAKEDYKCPRDVSNSVGIEEISVSLPPENDYYISPLNVDIENAYSARICLDYCGIEGHPYELLDKYGTVIYTNSDFGCVPSAAPYSVCVHLEARGSCVFNKNNTPMIYINDTYAAINVIDSRHATATAEIELYDDDHVVDTIDLYGNFNPKAGESAATYNADMESYFYSPNTLTEVDGDNSYIAAGQYDSTPFNGTFEAGKTYYAVINVEPGYNCRFGLEVDFRFHDTTGELDPADYEAGIPGYVGYVSATSVKIPFTIPGGALIGDVDQSGVIDIGDITLLAKYVAGWTLGSSFHIENANCDGISGIDIGDITMLAKYVAGWNVTLG